MDDPELSLNITGKEAHFSVGGDVTIQVRPADSSEDLYRKLWTVLLLKDTRMGRIPTEGELIAKLQQHDEPPSLPPLEPPGPELPPAVTGNGWAGYVRQGPPQVPDGADWELEPGVGQ